MKIPKITRLPSGSWTCQIRIGGRSYSVTGSSKAQVQRQAEALKAELRLNGPPSGSSGTLASAIDRYIRSRPDLSPSTVGGYRRIQQHHFQGVMQKTLAEKIDWQGAINQEAAIFAPKTVYNAWGLLSSVLKENGILPGNVRLPAKKQKDLNYLTAEQLPVFLEAIKGEAVEGAALLALHSLRRSELLALDVSDVRDGFIYVHRAAVEDASGKLVVKEKTKTEKSTRRIRIFIPRLLEVLPKEGRAVTVSIYYSTQRIHELCKKAGLPEVGLHDLRRTYASLAYHLGIGDMEIMLTGGWSNLQTVRKIYTKVSEEDLLRSTSKMESFYHEIANENANDYHESA